MFESRSNGRRFNTSTTTVVCDLIEEKRPPGIFAALNDACAKRATQTPTAADNSFVQRLSALSSNAHFENRGSQFLVKHYAGDVMYNISGMTDKNKGCVGQGLVGSYIEQRKSIPANAIPRQARSQ